MGSVLDLEALTVDYGSFRAVDALDLTTEPGEIVALLGASGCGKTTTLRAIAGLAEITSGTIHVDGARIDRMPPHRRGVGLVFQNYALFPHMTVAENVRFGLKMLGKGTDADNQKRIRSALRLLQVEDHAGAYPKELSGGQQQRVALARSLVTEPRVLLLDEALSALDKKLRDAMRSELRALLKRLEITTVIVTHDQEEALTMADRIALMRAGRIEQIGTPEEIYNRPATHFAADFIGKMNSLEGIVIEKHAEILVIETGSGAVIQAPGNDSGHEEGAVVRVCFRPESASWQVASADEDPAGSRSELNVLDGVVESFRFTGDRLTATVRIDDQASISVTAPADRPRNIEMGAAVTVRWPTSRTLVFLVSENGET